MAEQGDRTNQDIGSDEAYTCNLKNVVDTHFNIGAMALQETQKTISAAHKQSATELAAINQITIGHLKDVSAYTLKVAEVNLDRQINVDEQGYQATDILGGPAMEAIQAMIVKAVTDAIGNTTA
jgi:hypothetical protein